MAERGDIIIGIDSGTSVVKAVAFTTAGVQIDSAAVRNRYSLGAGGAATQPLAQTWNDCVAALRALGDKVPDLSRRVLALAVTGQGDGTWLVDGRNQPVGDAWIWLDARAAPTVERLASGPLSRARFEATGTGLNTCQQGTQLAHMQANHPELFERADAALHCKDWLYLNLTGVRATDPSEASFTFGNFRTRAYDDTVLAALGLEGRRALLPPIVDGTLLSHPLSAAAAAATGLAAGTPVSLGYVDMAMTALGAGVFTGEADVACSVIGSTGVHMMARAPADVHLNAEGTGYVIALPSPGVVTQVQTNMAATLNIDWLLGIAAELIGEVRPSELIGRIDGWLERSEPGTILYHPYISEAGERGPFVNARARAAFSGLSAGHGFADLARAVIEGIGFAMRDCYGAMGGPPAELRLTGGAVRSAALRRILGAMLGVPLRVSSREEAGAAGAAMMAAVAQGVHADMLSCVSAWVTPLFGATEASDRDLGARYAALFPAYVRAREAFGPVWDGLAAARAVVPSAS